MDEDNEEVRELFARYGLLVYLAQGIEKQIITLSINIENITKSRYDEIHYEKSLLPFGLLKKELEATGRFTSEELKKIDEFNLIRNNLVHHFWWDRAVEFYVKELRNNIFSKLDEIETVFTPIDELMHIKAENLAKKYNIDLPKMEEELINSGKTPAKEDFRKLTKEETIIDIKRYNLSPTSAIPLFLLEDNTYWTVCESGLTQYKLDIDNSKFQEIALLKGIFPVKQFNPRPKKNEDWNYDLLLKTGRLQISIRPIQKEGFNTFKWSVNKAKR